MVYKKCLAHYSRHLIEALRVYQQELNNISDTKNIEQNDADDVEYKKLLGMQSPNYNGSQFELKTDFGQHLKKNEYN